MPKEEIVHPGAGTLYVYGNTRGSSPAGRNSRTRNKGSKERNGRGASPFATTLPAVRWDDVVKHLEDPTTAPNPDSLLKHGITEYTYMPVAAGGVLGRGKFSTVYKVLGVDGNYYALKHTPLYPHHPLISARLLREPTLLAELPSHPCLIGVEGWVRTDGHFYLIEQYASSHVPLPTHPLPLRPSRAAYILDQLVSVIRDNLHEKGRVCHRDLKGDNVLIDVETGEILILDLGLATRFSASEPKLTTCCGSPAFHSPEIVQALARPPGEVTYYGPELDIWCIALTLLSLLLQVKFPLGPKHTSPYVMRERVRDRLQELDEMYPPHAPWRPPRSSTSSRSSESSQADSEFEKKEWTRVRRAMKDFLDIDGHKRMYNFQSYQLGEKIRKRVMDWDENQQIRKFKSTSFIESEIKYTLPIYLDQNENHEDVHSQRQGKKHKDKDKGKKDIIVLRNPMGESERRCKSYIKYLLRSAGILYHLLPASQNPSTCSTPTTPKDGSKGSDDTIFQLVMDIPADLASDQHYPPNDPQVGWFPSLFSFHKKPPPINSAPTSPQQRSTSLPPSKRSETPAATPVNPPRDKSPKRVLRCYIKLEFVHEHLTSPMNGKRRGSVETFTSYRDGWGAPLTPLHPVTSNNSSTATQTTATTNKSYPFPPRSVSVSRNTPNRPGNRRSVSHASVPHPRQALTRVQTTSSINNNGLGNGVPLSPLSRQISLSDSPPNNTVEPLSRAQSRASSRSRQSSSGYTFPSAYSYLHNHNHPNLPNINTTPNHINESKIIIHLSDPRSYPILKKAFDIQPNVINNNNITNDLNFLSPMTIRRPSLAPSLTISVPDHNGESSSQNESSEDERGIKITRRKQHNAKDEEIIEEEERGRPRSKEGNSSSILQLQQIKSRDSISTSTSITNSIKRLPAPLSETVNEDLSLDIKHVEVPEESTELERKSRDKDNKNRQRNKSKARSNKPSRGLLEVIFGNTRLDDEDEVNANKIGKHEITANAGAGTSGLGINLGTGYGRAMRARSVPPYRGIEDLL